MPTRRRLAFFRMVESDAGTDEKNWRVYTQSDRFRIHTEDDNGSAVATPFEIFRTGTTVDEVALAATTLDFNGAADFSTSISVSGHVNASGSGAARLSLQDTAAPTNEGRWVVRSASGQLQFQTYTDAGGFGASALIINRTGTNVDSFAITADSVTVNGDPVLTGNSGTFSPSWTGFSSAPTQNIRYSVVHGVSACLSMGGATNQGTSNSTAFTLSGIPAAARPATFAVRTACRLTNSGSTVNGMCRVTTGGGITFGVDNLTSPNGGNDWTGSGTKGLAGSDWMLCYPIN